MQQWLGWLVCLASLLWSLTSPVQAAGTDALYEASVPVSGQGESDKLLGLRSALQQVLVRISGQTGFDANVVIQEALNNPEAYVRQFGYTSLADKDKPGMEINASFVPVSVVALLRRAQLPVWPANRPSVLAWVVVDTGNGKQMINQVDGAQDFLLKESGRRGLPVVMPMNDLNDQVALGEDRLWNLDQQAVEDASKRYGEDSILVGRVAQISPGQWQGNWLYLLKGQPVLIEKTSVALEDFLAAGVQLAIQTQVQKYGTNITDSTNMIDVDIAGVDNLKRYSEVMGFLKKIEIINTIHVTGLEAGLLRCSLEVSGSSESLREMMGLGRLLVLDVTPDAEGDVPTSTSLAVPPLRYHYVGQ